MPLELIGVLCTASLSTPSLWKPCHGQQSQLEDKMVSPLTVAILLTFAVFGGMVFVLAALLELVLCHSYLKMNHDGRML